MKIMQALIVIFFITACSQRDPERFYSKEKDFSIKFPSGWNTREGYMGSIVRAENPSISKEDNFQENINIVSDLIPGEMTIDQYFTAGKNLLKEALPGLKEEGGGTCSIDGRNSYWFIYSYPLKPIRIKVIVYNVIIKRKVYLITCTSDEKKFSSVRDLFDGSARSFQEE